MTEVSQMPTGATELSTNSFQFEERPNSLTPQAENPTWVLEMNPNSTPNISDNQRNTNMPMNPGLRPPGANPPIITNNPLGVQQMRPVRTEQPNSSVRMENANYQMYQQRQQQYLQQQQLQQQQRNMYQNYQQAQRPPMGFQTNSGMERPNGPHQNVTVGQPQGQRMPPQQRFTVPQSLIRGPVNGTQPNQPLNQPRPLNFQHLNPPSRPEHPQKFVNSQEAPQIDNYKEQVVRDPNHTLTRRSSNLGDLQSVSNSSQRMGDAEIKAQPENNAKPADAENHTDQLTAQGPIQKTEEIKSEQEESLTSSSKNGENKDIRPGSISPETKPQLKLQSRKRKEDLKDGTIAPGTVHKNIQFFEENDTAKTPLTPAALVAKKKERTAASPGVVVDVARDDDDDDESGVDETPVVHPKLRSIYQPPRKVAKIPHVKPTKGVRRSKPEKKSMPRRPFQEGSKNKQSLGSSNFGCSSKSFQGFSRSPYQTDSKKKQKVKLFTPDEELLEFFENSKLLRNSKRGGSRSSGDSASKDKLSSKPTTNGDNATPKKTPSKLPGPSKKNPPTSPTKTPLKSPGTPGKLSLPKTPETPSPPTPLIKKVPMNKIQVGAAPSPNLKAVRSKVGSLANTTHKPGGGNVKVETHKIDFSKTQPRIEAKNLQYAPSGGEKKITQVKLQWSAQSKIGSLENATYKPGGGDKKIESVKLDFKEKAKPKVGSKDNVKHVPGGGNIKIENQKLEFKAQSKVGSLDNVKHRPGGGDIKIFDDKTYLKQLSGNSSEGRVSGTQSYGDLSVVREVEGRSAPGTPGRKTAVKIRKITTIQNAGDSPTLKNVTEVTVVSQTPKKDKNVRISPTKEQIKLTYSKFSSSKNEDSQGYVGLIKIPVNENAPILKSNLSRKDVLSPEESEKTSKLGSQVNGNEKTPELSQMESSKEKKNLENFAQSSGSPNLPEGKLNVRTDSGMSKFLQDEMAAHDKISEMWREMNAMEHKPNLDSERHTAEQIHTSQDSFYTNPKAGMNPQQLRPSGIYANDPQRGFGAAQNIQPQSFYRSPAHSQGEQNYQLNNQQRMHSAAPQYRISPQQQNQFPHNNPQFQDN